TGHALASGCTSLLPDAADTNYRGAAARTSIANDLAKKYAESGSTALTEHLSVSLQESCCAEIGSNVLI
ncbi:MAG: hypothetical protein AB7I32_20580, partial [Gammaproteobacteria bacterium]